LVIIRVENLPYLNGTLIISGVTKGMSFGIMCAVLAHLLC